MVLKATSIGPKHENNLSSLRLLFASLVILSHSPELVDGDRSREILTRMFGTMSFGELGVDGFFLISGYLITKSLSNTHNLYIYFTKRIARIVPGYILCFLLCFFLVAPLVGASNNVSLGGLKRFVQQTTRLLPPEAPGAFAELPYPSINGSMWTISYEFRCYIVVALIGLIAARLRLRREWLIVLVAAGIIATASKIAPDLSFSTPQLYFGNPIYDVRFGTVFATGSLFYIFQDKLPFNIHGAITSIFFLLVGLLYKYTAEATFMLFGGYLIFWAAFGIRKFGISQRADSTDLSYGLYLYAWPIQNSIIYVDRDINPWALALLTLGLAALIALLSWRFVEKPCLDIVHAMSRRSSRLHSQLMPPVRSSV